MSYAHIVDVFAALAVGGLAAGALGLLAGTVAYIRVVRLRGEWATTVREAAVVSGSDIDPRAIRNVALRRYDALRDMGGRLSFSLALLDSVGDGVVLSSINAHSETRTYAKAIQGGESVSELSPEEQQVLAEARDDVRQVQAAADGQAATDAALRHRLDS